MSFTSEKIESMAWMPAALAAQTTWLRAENSSSPVLVRSISMEAV